MKRVYMYAILVLAIVVSSSFGFPILHKKSSTHSKHKQTTNYSHPSASFLRLPNDFHVEIVAENLGTARHLAVTKQGVVYVKLGKLKNGKGIIALEDINGEGKAGKETGFGNFIGTGIYIKNGYLYASSNTDVYRYKLNDNGEVIDTAHAERIVTGLLDRHEHNSKSIVLDNGGNIYVNVGAYSNACQIQDRMKGSAGVNPCPILDSAAGI